MSKLVSLFVLIFFLVGCGYEPGADYYKMINEREQAKHDLEKARLIREMEVENLKPLPETAKQESVGDQVGTAALGIATAAGGLIFLNAILSE